jgi:CHAT domain-containing protein
VLISPDGPLTRFPPAALPGRAPGSFLIEEQAVALVPVPRLLPELLAGKSAAKDSLLLVGAVDFDTGLPERSAGPVVALSRGGKQLAFGPLPATEREIAAVRTTFAGTHAEASVEELHGSAATPLALLCRAPEHRYLHLATHGFFAPPAMQSAASSALVEAPESLVSLLGPAGRGAIGTTLTAWHPGLLSGLALAGANDPTGAGVLSALEVQSLDLRGTELVVLSACETGLGDVAGGEGVFGLQRAFQLSGARTVVASLWSVNDTVTQRLMDRFYDNLWSKGMVRLEALRQAQLGILFTDEDGQRERTHPSLWAGWVLSGAPGDLTQAGAAFAEPESPLAPAPAAPDLWTPVGPGAVVAVVLVLFLLTWRRRGTRA